MSDPLNIVHLPDLRTHSGRVVTPRPVAGWFVLETDGVSVPTWFDVQRCAREALGPGAAPDPCETHVVAFDPPNRTTIVALGASGALTVRAKVTPSFPAEEPVASTCAPAVTADAFRDRVPVLVVQSERANDTFRAEVPGTVVDPQRQQLLFTWQVPSQIAGGFADGLYALAVEGFEADEIVIDIALAAGPHAPTFSADPCALTLVPDASSAGRVLDIPATIPRPPLLAVDASGCVVEAWSVDAAGRVLVPNGDTQVLLQASCRGGVIAVLEVVSGGVAQPIRDAIFWLDRIAVLTGTAAGGEVRTFDLAGCPTSPAVVATGLPDPIALAVSDEGFLMVVQRTQPNLRMFRRDGSEVLAPASFDGRGFYARHRNGAFFFDPVACAYLLSPALVAGQDCCASPARPLTDDESLLFRIIDDLRDLRKRTSYPLSGQAILGPEQGGDTLDAGRPGTQWHRILVFGDIPAGCGVRLETRASDDILAGDPLVPTGWSLPVTATTSSAVEVASPGDTRGAAAAALVLAGQGRFLWIRLTLLSNGVATPRVTALELEHPRDGISRFLPQFIQNSTPEDDFLRRWLALFENTTFDGVAERMDQYAELFDPRTAPPEMLPFLAGWLQILELARFQEDQDAFRAALTQAAALAETRGTVDGLILAVHVYMGISIQIVESFKRGSGFILGTGTTIDGVTGPALGCQTGLSAEAGPTWLGDAPLLGDTFLLDCERRFGTVPFQFEVLVPARDVCRSEDLALLRTILDIEKPAHTNFRIRQTAVAGFVVGDAILGQSVGRGFDRNELDPASFGVLVQGGPGRPQPIGQGFTLGLGSRLFAASVRQAGFRLDGADNTLGRTTQI
jgi:phage tail-like protein